MGSSLSSCKHISHSGSATSWGMIHVQPLILVSSSFHKCQVYCAAFKTNACSHSTIHPSLNTKIHRVPFLNTSWLNVIWISILCSHLRVTAISSVTEQRPVIWSSVIFYLGNISIVFLSVLQQTWSQNVNFRQVRALFDWCPIWTKRHLYSSFLKALNKEQKTWRTNKLAKSWKQ